MSTVPPGTYQHYKGQKYLVLGTAKHSETLEDMVVYITLYDNKMSAMWVRPLEMFLETVTVAGKKVPRFKLVTLKP